jgi:methionine aminopeptidase
MSVAGNEVELVARKAGFTVVPCFTGHGIGSYFHGPPDIYHCCKCQKRKRLVSGLHSLSLKNVELHNTEQSQ